MVAAEGYIRRAADCSRFYWKVGCRTPPTASWSSVGPAGRIHSAGRHRLARCPLQWRTRSTLLTRMLA